MNRPYEFISASSKMQRLISVLCLFSAAASLVVADQVEINVLVDAIITAVDESLQSSAETTLTLPDMEHDYKVSFIKGGVKATRGTLSDLSSLARSGDALLALNDDSATLTISMGLSTLELYYEHCRAWLGALSTSEKLAVYVGENAIQAVITLTIDSTTSCSVVLNSVTVTDFGDLTVDMMSLGDFKYIANHIAEWIIDDFNDDIKSSVESVLFNIISAELSSVDLCSLIVS